MKEHLIAKSPRHRPGRSVSFEANGNQCHFSASLRKVKICLYQGLTRFVVGWGGVGGSGSIPITARLPQRVARADGALGGALIIQEGSRCEERDTKDSLLGKRSV